MCKILSCYRPSSSIPLHPCFGSLGHRVVGFIKTVPILGRISTIIENLIKKFFSEEKREEPKPLALPAVVVSTAPAATPVISPPVPMVTLRDGYQVSLSFYTSFVAKLDAIFQWNWSVDNLMEWDYEAFMEKCKDPTYKFIPENEPIDSRKRQDLQRTVERLKRHKLIDENENISEDVRHICLLYTDMRTPGEPRKSYQPLLK